MESKYLIDSNVIIDYMANRFSPSSNVFIENIFETEFVIPSVVKIEVLGFSDVQKKLEALEEFVDHALIIPLEKNIIDQTIKLKREYKKLKLPDAIIAATAIVCNSILITRNISDFKNVLDLKFINPHEI